MDVVARLAVVAVLVFANAFFVASEYALVRLRRSRIEQMALEGRATGRLLLRWKDEFNRFISAVQLGITMSSLALGWVGEATIATVIDPLFLALPETLHGPVLHTVSIVISFSLITLLHIVLGEQVPKMVALQYTERTAVVTIGPIDAFSRIFRPFIALFTWATRAALRALGVRPELEREAVHGSRRYRARLAQ